MAKKLRTSVHVHTEDGGVKVYQAGDEVPAEDAKRITNPDVWEGDEADEMALLRNDSLPMNDETMKAMAKAEKKADTAESHTARK